MRNELVIVGKSVLYTAILMGAIFALARFLMALDHYQAGLGLVFFLALIVFVLVYGAVKIRSEFK